jgi:hypothetical protein
MEHVGPGTRYDQCLLEYMNIGNIHTMRGSLQKLMEALENADSRKQEQGIERSDWKEHIARILTGAAKISNTLDVEGEPVLVHCTGEIVHTCFPDFIFANTISLYRWLGQNRPIDLFDSIDFGSLLSND